MATPQAMIAPRQGKWWNEVEGKWIYTDLVKDGTTLDGVPDDDSDLLRDIQGDIDNKSKKDVTAGGGEVKETYYYDVLEIGPTAEQSAIKRKYYVMARKYHPDKVGKDDKEAADKFKDVAEGERLLKRNNFYTFIAHKTRLTL